MLTIPWSRTSRLTSIRPVSNYGKGFRSISKRHPTIYLRARPSRFLTAEAVMAACFMKWNFIRANALSSGRRTTWRRMRISQRRSRNQAGRDEHDLMTRYLVRNIAAVPAGTADNDPAQFQAQRSRPVFSRFPIQQRGHGVPHAVINFRRNQPCPLKLCICLDPDRGRRAEPQ